MTAVFRRTAVLLFAAGALVLSGCETVQADRTEATAYVNESRTQGGLGAVTENNYLSNRAEESSKRMRNAWVAAGCPMWDASGNPYLTHTTNLQGHYKPEQVRRNWKKLGENIGVVQIGTDPRSIGTKTLHDAYMNSPKHRDNIMGSYDLIGVGTVLGPTAEQASQCPGVPVNSVMWNTQVFVK